MAQAFTLDNGAGHSHYAQEKEFIGTRIGLVVLQSDESLEQESRIALAKLDLIEPVAIFHSRIPNQQSVSKETLQEMHDELPRAVNLLPKHLDLDALGYACTSGATVIGSDNIAAIINATHTKAKTSDPILAVMMGLKSMACRNIAFVTPYIQSVTQAMREKLEANQFSITNLISFEQGNDEVVSRISEQSTLEAIIEADTKESDAIFVSCTNLRTFSILKEVEEKIGKPVVSSNQALLWHLLCLAGVDFQDHKNAHHLGRLFQTQLV